MQGCLNRLSWVAVGIALLLYTLIIPPRLSATEPWESAGIVEKGRLLKNGTLLFLPLRVGGNRLNFLVDTGLTWSIIDSSLTTEWESLPDSVSVGTAGAAVKMQRFKAPRIELGKQFCEYARTICGSDLTELRKQAGQDVDGVVGMDVLHRFALHLDFDREDAFAFNPHSEETPPGSRLPMAFDDSALPCIVAGRVGREDSLFRLDTGMTGTGDLSPYDHAAWQRDGALTSSGVATSAFVGDNTLKTLDLWRCSKFSVAERTYDGLKFMKGRTNKLGMSFLRRHRVTLDFVNRKAYLEPGRGFSLRDRNDFDGLVLKDGLFIGLVAKDSVAEKCGFQAFDRIVKIADKPASKLTLESASHELTLPRQEPLLVHVERETRELVLTLPEG